MDSEEHKTLKTMLRSEDLDFVDQALLLWESFVIDFPEFLDDLRAITNRKDADLYKKEGLLNIQRLKQLFKHFHHRGYLAVWAFGILCSFDQFQNQRDWIHYLELSNSRLSKLPESFNNCKDIKTLRLHGNHFTSDNLSALFEFLEDFPRLEKLHLSQNRITKLPKTINNCPKLHFLDLSNNWIEELPDEIGSLKNLVHLKLQNNRLQKLPDSFENLQNLRFLNLSMNLLRHHPEGLKNMVRCQVVWKGNPYRGDPLRAVLPVKPYTPHQFPPLTQAPKSEFDWPKYVLYVVVFLIILNILFLMD